MPNGKVDILEGFVKPLFNVPFSNFNLKSDKAASGEYHFIVDNETFKFKIIKDICDCNIEGKNPTYSLNDIDNIPLNKLRHVKEEIEKQFIYGSECKYPVVEAIIAHEDTHQVRLLLDINIALKNNFDGSEFNYLKNIKFKDVFSSYNSQNNDLVKAKEDYWKLLYYLGKEIERKHNKRFENRFEEEQSTQKAIKHILLDYIAKIDNRINP